MDFTVRRVTSGADHDAILSLWERAGLPFEPAGRDGRAAFERQLASGAQFVYVAERDGRTVGVVLATHDGRKGWINRLAVDPACRRGGLARALVGAAEAALREAGLSIVAALVEAPNPASQALFRALGYQERRDIVYYRKPF